MRTIKLPPIDWSELRGVAVVVPVLVGWPELQLTEDQILQNTIATLNGEDPPHEEPIINVEIPRPLGLETKIAALEEHLNACCEGAWCPKPPS